MELIDYARVLRRRWVLVLAGSVAGLAVGTAWAELTPPTYSTTAELFVGSTVTGGTAATSGPAQSASQFILTRMDSYAALIESPDVAKQVTASLPFRLTLSQFRGSVTANVPAKTVLLRVSATDRSPQRAAEIANAAADRLRSNIEVLETPSGGGPAPVRVTITGPATQPNAPASPDKKLGIFVGLILGLGAGLFFAALRDQAAQRQTRPGTTGSNTLGAGPHRSLNTPAGGTENAEPLRHPRAADSPVADGSVERADGHAGEEYEVFR